MPVSKIALLLAFFFLTQLQRRMCMRRREREERKGVSLPACLPACLPTPRLLFCSDVSGSSLPCLSLSASATVSPLTRSRLPSRAWHHFCSLLPLLPPCCRCLHARRATAKDTAMRVSCIVCASGWQRMRVSQARRSADLLAIRRCIGDCCSSPSCCCSSPQHCCCIPSRARRPMQLPRAMDQRLSKPRVLAAVMLQAQMMHRLRLDCPAASLEKSASFVSRSRAQQSIDSRMQATFADALRTFCFPDPCCSSSVPPRAWSRHVVAASHYRGAVSCISVSGEAAFDASLPRATGRVVPLRHVRSSFPLVHLCSSFASSASVDS